MSRLCVKEKCTRWQRIKAGHAREKVHRLVVVLLVRLMVMVIVMVLLLLLVMAQITARDHGRRLAVSVQCHRRVGSVRRVRMRRTTVATAVQVDDTGGDHCLCQHGRRTAVHAVAVHAVAVVTVAVAARGSVLVHQLLQRVEDEVAVLRTDGGEVLSLHLTQVRAGHLIVQQVGHLDVLNLILTCPVADPLGHLCCLPLVGRLVRPAGRFHVNVVI